MAKARPVLVIGPNLKLPEEAVTETFAILGKRGVGKTTTARVLTEELLGVGLPALILDPTGVWSVDATTGVACRRCRAAPAV